MRALVTGASGFVGTALRHALRSKGIAIRAAGRGQVTGPVDEVVAIGDLSGDIDWSPILQDVDVVFHAAALAHTPLDSAMLEHLQKVNVQATARLAEAVASSEARRLVFVSSAKVHGESSAPARPFKESDGPAPGDAYARSKVAAENALRAALPDRCTIVRPPLVYGPGVRANFRSLLAAVARGLPLPFGSIDNRRSLIAVDNLADALITAAVTSEAAGETYLVSDGEDLSTPALVRLIAEGLGRRARLIDVPPRLLRSGAALFGKAAQLEKVIGSLQIDIRKVKLLGWQPPLTTREAIAATAQWYAGQESTR